MGIVGMGGRDMTYLGKVKDGVIVLQPGLHLPEGTDVEISVAADRNSSVESVGSETPTSEKSREDQPRTLYERMKPIIGSVNDLPTDFAINHDHYLHGAPKRQ
jgi:hypothetical protein